MANDPDESQSGDDEDETSAWATTDPMAATFQETTGDTADERGDGDRKRSSRPDLVDGRYRVESLLGRGSMGNVFKVEDTMLDETVALKVLRQKLADDADAVARFRREVKLARRVTHPNVARVYDLGEGERVPYLTMEYLDGRPLREVLDRRGALGLEEVATVVEAVCAGLEAAHDAGVVHRDLKPGNVILGDERIVVTDFGIARVAKEGTTLAELTGRGLVGTPTYMAPEQVKKEEVDRRADIYALGVMIYEMLTGESPWEESSAIDVALERCRRPAPALPESGGWSEQVRRVVRRAMRRSPDDRLDDLDRLIEGLRELRSDEGAWRSESGAEEGASERDDGAGDVGLGGVPSGKTVAVLPFAAPEADADYLGTGLAEQIVDWLSRREGLRVISLDAVEGLDAPSTAREVGERLGARVVVVGEFDRDEEDRIVRAAAVSVDRGLRLWSGKYAAGNGELVDAGRRIALGVAGALAAGDERPEGAELGDPAATDRYMRAQEAMLRGWYSGLGPAVGFLEEALEYVPDHPRILADLAVARARAAFLDHEERAYHIAEAREHARRAIDSAPQLAESYFALASVHYHGLEFGHALRRVEQALERSSDFVDAHALRGRILAEIGSLDVAARHLERALDLNPFDYDARWDLVRVRALRGQWEAVDEWLGRGVDARMQEVLRHGNRRRLDLWRDNPVWLDECGPELPSGSDFAQLAPIMKRVAATGRLADDDRARLEETAPATSLPSRYLALQCQFRVELGVRGGDYEFALRYLEGARDAGLVDKNWLMGCPLMAPLAETDRYRRVREDVEARVQRFLHSHRNQD